MKIRLIKKRNKYKFTFSIVMAVYNAEKWLDESIGSVINQDIGFRDEVQIILVNDGSSDASEEICLKYKEMYPDNILYISQKNGGPSKARNIGLKYACGKYINFLDSDDLLTKNTFSEVRRFFESNSHQLIHFVSIPHRLFGAEEGEPIKYQAMPRCNKIIDLDSSPSQFVLSASSTFFDKANIGKKLKFDTKTRYMEDAKMMMELYDSSSRFGYVCESNVEYMYRKSEGESLTNVARDNLFAHYSVIRLLNTFLKTDLSHKRYIEEIAIYMVGSKLRWINSTNFTRKNDYWRIVFEYRKVIKKLDPWWIAKKTKFITNVQRRYIFLSEILAVTPYNVIGSGHIAAKGRRLFLLSRLRCYVSSVEKHKNRVEIEILYTDYNISNLDVVFVDSKGMIVEPFERTEANTKHDAEYGSFHISSTHVLKYSLPSKQSYSLRYLDKVRNNQHVASAVRINCKLPKTRDLKISNDNEKLSLTLL